MEAGKGDSMKILLVDDSATMRSIQKMALSSLGEHEFREAGDGQKALQEIERDRPDLILLDWRMPKMDGLEVLRALKTSPYYWQIPVVMMTSESDRPKIAEALQAGASIYILKPFTPEILCEKVGPFLQRRPPSGSTASPFLEGSR